MNVKAEPQSSEPRECRRCREALLARLESVRPEPCAGASPDPEPHLRHCAACRQYEAELASALSVLRDLAAEPIQPTVAFERRWREAVRQSAPERDPALGSRLLRFLKELLWVDWKPATTLACLWLVIAGLNLTTPSTAQPSPAQSSAAASPVETLRWLEADARLLASLW